MDSKTTIALISIVIAFINFVYYMHSVYRGKTRPHLFTWLVWGLVTAIACAASFAKGGGTGAWLMLAVTVFCLGRCVAAWTHGDKSFTRSDKICLAFALLAIVAWQVTANPLHAVIIVTLIDLAGFYPTIRKTWHKPHEENAASYAMFGFTYFLGMLAIENYNLTTLLYPVIIAVTSWGYVAFMLWRRAQIKGV